MIGWLAYSGAFACAFGAAALTYVAAFNALMTGSASGIEAFILLAVVCPVLAGFVTFGVTFSAFSAQSLGAASWAQGLAFVAGVTGVCFGLLVADVLEEVPALLLLVVILFVGGRMMILRALND